MDGTGHKRGKGTARQKKLTMFCFYKNNLLSKGALPAASRALFQGKKAQRFVFKPDSVNATGTLIANPDYLRP
jgi:hypothetical protein